MPTKPPSDAQAPSVTSVDRSSESPNNVKEHDGHTSMLLYIGLALAVAVIVGLVVFVFSIVRHRKYQRAKRELKKVRN